MTTEAHVTADWVQNVNELTQSSVGRYSAADIADAVNAHTDEAMAQARAQAFREAEAMVLLDGLSNETKAKWLRRLAKDALESVPS